MMFWRKFLAHPGYEVIGKQIVLKAVPRREDETKSSPSSNPKFCHQC